MSTAAVVIVLTAILVSHVSVASLVYTKEAQTFGGKTCLTDCVNGQCWVSAHTQEHCNPGWKKAATYYTSRERVPSKSKCLSRCDFAGSSYSWCYVDEDANWDYCNPNTDDTNTWYQYSLRYGRCKTECGFDNTCTTYWNQSSESCEKIWYYQEQARTKYGLKCYGNCDGHDGHNYVCYNENRILQTCAPSAVRYQCPARRRRAPPSKTVADYNQAIDNDATLHTTTVSTLSNANNRNPVLDYTYRTTSSGLRLPVRVQARIRPQHIQGPNTRTRHAISPEARRNCYSMGMNVYVFGNHDQLGHLIPYILGGPSDWYNIVPQTRRINTGTTTDSDIIAPSVWSATERIMRRYVEDGGSVNLQVLVAYEPGSTRPSGFGVIDEYYDANGVLDFECSYWYSNDPNEDPDVWN